ncbi:MAG TPA: immunoglobulin domain-containing protein, partial [Opitutaceae bacterium]|nr:immunoglobulin domain-containing protein [Opitutaceae bacterium]
MRPCLRLLMAAFLLGPAGRAAAQAQARVTFPGSIREVPAVTTGARRAAAISRMALRTEERSAGMSFEVALRMRSFGELQARLAGGEQITPAEMAAKYYPLAADHERLVQWLRAQGLEVTRTDGNRLAVFGRGPVDAVAGAFQVTFARVAVADGEFTSAVTAPSLPTDVSAAVLGIHGLQPHIRRRPLSTPRLTLSVGGYTPAQISTAYNANGLMPTGAGQTIAFYELAFPSTGDLTAFWSASGVSQSTANVQMVNVAGGPTSPSSGSSEEAALDVEWGGALAPGAKLRIYGANENDPGLNDEILQQVYADIPSNPTMHQLCICIGGNELEVERDYLVIEAQYMANLASAGVSVLVASGDSGSTPNGILQTTYPTSDPDVTGVGGTSPTLTAAGAVTLETAWTGSGGGVSAVFSRPSWQVGMGVPAGATRVVPDVAAAGDPIPGAMLVFNGSPTAVGGTSWATPIWAAFCALLNQGRSTPLGMLNPKLYPLMGTASLRDITSGSNGAYNAGMGYDLCTGCGVPDVAALLAAPLAATAGLNIAAQLGNQVVTTGQPATFFVVGAGASPLGYRWQRQPGGSSTFANLADNGTYSGSATSTLVVSGTTSSMTGDQFQCVVSGGSSSVTSAPASLTVNPVGVTTLAGWPGSAGNANGTGKAARFAFPGSVRADALGNLYIADSDNDTIRKVTPAGVVTLVAGTPGTSGSADGPAATALFGATAGVAVDSSGNLFVADDGNTEIREISAAGNVTTLAGLAGSPGTVNGTGSAARFSDPQNLAIDGAGNLYVADGRGNTIRRVTPAGVVTTLAGSGTAGSSDGTGGAAQFNDPTGVTVDLAGNVYVADFGNNTIRVVTPGGAVTTLAGRAGRAGGADGTGAAARFNGPAGIGVDSAGNLYVADENNDTIREVTQGGVVTTVAGAAGVPENIDGIVTSARFYGPGDVTVDNSGVIYVADAENDTIRRIIPGASASAPSISVQPAGQSVNEGSAATFSVGVAGTPPFYFQWYFNGALIPGATGPSLGVANAQQSNVGTYSVSVTNAGGSATSASAALAVSVPQGYPNITAQPQGATLLNGGSVALSVTVSGSGPFTYQWILNGSAIAGATGSAYTATAPGSYTVSVTNSLASATSSAAFVSPSSRLVNVSSRELVGAGGGIAIAGYFIEGAPGQTKQVLIRGVGPALSAFGVGGLLAQPTI